MFRNVAADHLVFFLISFDFFPFLYSLYFLSFLYSLYFLSFLYSLCILSFLYFDIQGLLLWLIWAGGLVDCEEKAKGNHKHNDIHRQHKVELPQGLDQ